MQSQKFVEILATGFLALMLSVGFAQAGDSVEGEEVPTEEVSETPPVDAPPPGSDPGAGISGDSPQSD